MNRSPRPGPPPTHATRVYVRAGELAVGALFISLMGACSPDPAADLVEVIAGTGLAGYNGEGRAATESLLYLPTDVLRGPDGRLLVVDYNNYRIRAFQPDGTLATIVGSGEHAFSTPGASALDSALESPIDAAVGPDGALYIAAEHEGRILRLSSTGFVEGVAGSGRIGYDGDGGPALDAEIGFVGGFAFSGDGELYIADATAGTLRRVDLNGTIDTVVGAEPVQDLMEGPANAVGLFGPQRLAWDEENHRLLIADTFHNRICAYLPGTEQLVTVAGTGEAGHAGDGGPAEAARLSQPRGVALTPDGRILIADTANNTLRFVDQDGILHPLLGDDVAGPLPTTPALPEEISLNYPAGLFVDGDDLYLTSMLHHAVLKWTGALR